MKTRILHTKLWKDGFFADLTASEKILFIYYLTNERVNIIHCYEITEREIAFDTGIDRGTLNGFKEKMQASGKMLFFGDWVYLLNASRYEDYTGAKNDAAKEKLINEMPPEVKDWFTRVKNTPIDTPIDGGIYTPSIGSINHKSKIINNKTKNNNINNNNNNNTKQREKNELTIEQKAEWVVNTYNEIFNKSLKSYVAIVSNLEYWLGAGYTSLDIKRAMEIARYDEYWGDKLNPVILLRRKNTRGEEVDYIGQFLAKDKKYIPVAQRKQGGILEKLAAKDAEGGQNG